MKVTKEKAEENRHHVIEASSRLFREKGFDGVGVSTLMQAAGLTHGGFYKQFESKDDLIAKATQAALDQTVQRVSSLIGQDKRASLEKAVGVYLSDQHRDGVSEGCAFAALGPDAARHGPEVRQVMQRGVEDQLALLQTIVDAKAGTSNREAAIATMATMVGALVLARAVENSALSTEIMDVVAKSILAR
ncbi:TetR/AcrR family transcriptional regulator [Rhizobium skierniewicense]|uniref:TetR/AcrR family transcriptional regulator n=1 Tax=Rhizobium skierniewicense TaxID=984260 RepID=UPI001574C8BF|nr:TetR/AcrR family transcriptional regulator [Rhizobium skierniewicense]NTF34401.1 TetR/AcrR family transcriptional regulator [Rhizobium skierniewicense]